MSDTPLTDASISSRTAHAGYGSERIEVVVDYVEVNDARNNERYLREEMSLHVQNQIALMRALTALLAATDPPASITRYRKWAEAKRKAEELIASMDSPEVLEREAV